MNTITKNIAITTAVLSSVVSVYLTASFLFDLVPGIREAVALAVVGVCLELGKFLFSSLSITKSKAKKFLFGLVTSGLMAISISASYAALEKGILTASKQSESYQAITGQINQLNALAEQQRAANQITKAGDTLDKIDALIVQRSELPGESMAAEYGKQISLMSAIALELVCVLSLAVCAGFTVRKTTEPPTPAEPEQIGQTQISEFAFSFKNLEATRASSYPEQPKQVETESKTQIELDIRNAIISREVERPSIKGVRERFDGVQIANDKISAILRELGEAGHLEARGRSGWKYAN